MTQAEVRQRRSNKRGLATRQTMLDAAVRSLASGDPSAVSATRIAKESGATWGAVQYQFGDVDGFWAAVLHRTAERRDATFSAWTDVEPDAPLGERVGAIIDTLYHGLASDRFPRDRESARGAPTRPPRTGTPLSTHRCRTVLLGQELAGNLPKRLRRTGCRPAASSRGGRPHPGAMRGLVSERQLGSYADLDEARRGLTNALAGYLESAGQPPAV